MKNSGDIIYWFALCAVVAVFMSAIYKKMERRLDRIEDSIGQIAIKAYCVGLADGRRVEKEASK